MTDIKNLKGIQEALNAASTADGTTFSAELLDGSSPVLQIIVDDREEFPIFLTVDETQILCVCNLWKTSEIKDGQQAQLNETLLRLNLPIPLSSFSMVGDQYLVFGALDTNSHIDNVIHEVEVLSDNTVTVIDELSNFLN